MLTNLIIALRLDSCQESEQLVLEVIVIFHPTQLPESIEVVVDNVTDVLVVLLLLIVVDDDHAKSRALLVDRNPLMCYRVGYVLYLNQ